MIRPILQYPHPALSKPSTPFTDEEFDSAAVWEVATDIADTLNASKTALGLAAPQISHARSAFGLKTPNGVIVLFNPLVLEKGPMRPAREGCLSFGSLFWSVPSPEWVAMSWKDEHGKIYQERDDTDLSMALFHEAEHCQGRTIVDRLGKLERREFLKALAKVRR